MSDNRIGDLLIFPTGTTGTVIGLTCLKDQNGGTAIPNAGTNCITFLSSTIAIAASGNAVTFTYNLVPTVGLSVTPSIGGATISTSAPLFFPLDNGAAPGPINNILGVHGLTGGNIWTSGSSLANTIFISLTGTIPVSSGGTGSNTYITNQIIVFNGTSFSSLPNCTAPGQLLVCEGSGLPSWVSITGSSGISVNSTGGTITITGFGFASSFGTDVGGPAVPSSGTIFIRGCTNGNIVTSAANNGETIFICLTGTIPVSSGGTGSNTYITNQIIVFNGTSFSSIPQCTSPGQVLVCEGSGLPSWVSITGIAGIGVVSTGGTITISGASTASLFYTNVLGDVACPAGGAIGLLGQGNIFVDTATNGMCTTNTIFISLTGTIPVSSGGTGSNTYITNQIIVFNGTSFSSMPQCTSPGQVLVCEGSGLPSWVSIMGGGTTTVISNGGNITISSSGVSTGGASLFYPDNGTGPAMATGGVIFIQGCPGGNITTTVPSINAQTFFICLTGTIPVSSGGTGSNTYITNQIIVFNGTSFSSLPNCTAPGQVLVCEGSGLPSWVSITGSSGISVDSTGGTITITGAALASSFGTDIGGPAVPSSGTIFIRGCTNGNIITSAANNGETLFICLTGTIPVSSGGTGSNTYITNQIIVFNGTSFSSLPQCTSPGQVLVCEGSGLPSWVSVVGSSGITVTSTGSTVIISGSGVTGFTWNDVTSSTSVNMVANNGYVVDNTGAIPIQFFLPANATFGDIYRIAGGVSASATTPWEVEIGAAGQLINMGSSTNLTAITATKQFDTIEILCIVSGSTTARFTVLNQQGGPFETAP